MCLLYCRIYTQNVLFNEYLSVLFEYMMKMHFKITYLLLSENVLFPLNLVSSFDTVSAGNLLKQC